LTTFESHETGERPGSDDLLRYFIIKAEGGDIPTLLERVRIAIIGRGAIDVLDLNLRVKQGLNKGEAEMTVYYKLSTIPELSANAPFAS
jgi:hypothetical protein